MCYVFRLKSGFTLRWQQQHSKKFEKDRVKENDDEEKDEKKQILLKAAHKLRFLYKPSENLLIIN